MSEIKKPKRHSPLSHVQSKRVSSSIRERVLKAAFTLFREHGFSSTSMLDIVTRARVSKRDLYALFNNKHAVLAACISERAQRMRRPLDTTTSVPQTRDAQQKEQENWSCEVAVHAGRSKAKLTEVCLSHNLRFGPLLFNQVVFNGECIEASCVK